jgi:hypothetical protein
VRDNEDASISEAGRSGRTVRLLFLDQASCPSSKDCFRNSNSISAQLSSAAETRDSRKVALGTYRAIRCSASEINSVQHHLALRYGSQNKSGGISGSITSLVPSASNRAIRSQDEASQKQTIMKSAMRTQRNCVLVLVA